MANKKVLHVVPDSVTRVDQHYLGSTKDIRGRTEYFQSRGLEYEELSVYQRSDENLLSILKEKDLSAYKAIFYELPLYPRTMAYVRQKNLKIKQITRTINADFYHYLHYFWGALVYSKRKLILPKIWEHSYRLRLAFNNLRLNYECALESDFILAIVDWEERNYWRYLASRDKLRTLPYFLPSQYEKESAALSVKKDQCLCLMSSSHSTLPLLQDALYNYSRLIQMLGNELPDWRFFVTGDLSRVNFLIENRVSQTGFLESPFPLLVESRAMALLSDYGFGFKTKLLDAAQSGCYILVPQRLYNRLPEEIKPFCIVVNIKSVQSFRNALEKCKEPFPEGDPNARLRENAFTVLDELLLR